MYFHNTTSLHDSKFSNWLYTFLFPTFSTFFFAFPLSILCNAIYGRQKIKIPHLIYCAMLSTEDSFAKFHTKYIMQCWYWRLYWKIPDLIYCSTLSTEDGIVKFHLIYYAILSSEDSVVKFHTKYIVQCYPLKTAL